MLVGKLIRPQLEKENETEDNWASVDTAVAVAEA